jgi:hypothetical protein
MILDPPAAFETLHSVLHNLRHLDLKICMADVSQAELVHGSYQPNGLDRFPLPSSVLGHATNLTSLQLSVPAPAAEAQAAEDAAEPPPPPLPPAEAYAALTASIQLQHLDLADCTLHE